MNTKLVSVTSLLVGLAIGLAIGRKRETPPPVQVVPEEPRKQIVTVAEPDLPPTAQPNWPDRLEEIRSQMVEPQWYHRNYRLISLLSQIPVEELPHLARALLPELQERRGRDALWIIFLRWSELDPAAALVAAKAFAAVAVRTQALKAVHFGWAKNDPDAAKRHVLNLAPGPLRKKLALVLIEEMTARNPPAALDLLEHAEIWSYSYSEAVMPIFRNWARSDADGAMAAARRMNNIPGRSFAQRAVIEMIAESDPLAAWKRIGELPATVRSDTRNAIVSNLAKTDVQLAMEYARKINPSDRLSALHSVIQVWMERDPGGLAAWSKTADDRLIKSIAERSLQKQRLEHDPQGMADYITTLTDRTKRHELARQLASSWGNSDPAAAIEWARALPPGQTRRRVLESLAYGIADSDPHAVAELIEKDTAGSHRKQLERNLAEQWSRRDPEGALEWFDSLSDFSKKGTAGPIVSAIAREDPSRAADILATLPSSFVKQSGGAVSLIARNWTATDPDRTLTWIDSLPDTSIRQEAYREFAQTLVTEDRTLALAMVDQLDEGGRHAMVHTLARNWALADSEAALSWVDTLPAEESADVKMSAILSIASMDPRAAAETVSFMPAGAAQDQIANAVVHTWSYQDPAAAANWATEFPPGELRNLVVSGTVENWVDEDSAGAEEFVRSLPKDELRTLAASALIEGMSRNEPASASKWIPEINDKEKRTELIKTVGSSWLMHDSDQAVEWMRSVGLTAKQIEELDDDVESSPYFTPDLGQPVLDAMGNPIFFR